MAFYFKMQLGVCHQLINKEEIIKITLFAYSVVIGEI